MPMKPSGTAERAPITLTTTPLSQGPMLSRFVVATLLLLCVLPLVGIMYTVAAQKRHQGIYPPPSLAHTHNTNLSA
jgi:hypothetical protein